MTTINKFKTRLRFARILKFFDEETYFSESEYDYYEIFDPEKVYDTEYFTHDYGYGQLVYYFTKIEINDMCSTETLHYVAAIENYSSNPIEHLKQYCQCKYHTSPLLYKLFYSFHDTGCLHSNAPTLKIIKQTRIYVKNFVNIENNTNCVAIPEFGMESFVDISNMSDIMDQTLDAISTMVNYIFDKVSDVSGNKKHHVD